MVGDPRSPADHCDLDHCDLMVTVPGPRRQAVEPPASRWEFPTQPRGRSRARALRAGPGAEIVGVGADLEPGTLLRAYRTGVFPMPAGRGRMAWWSPDPRGVLPLCPGGLRISRSLRRSCSRFEIRVDTAFAEVLDACGDRRRPGAWIDDDIRAAYLRLHELGWAHSVEAWTLPSPPSPLPAGGGGAGRSGEPHLAGGLYGLALGGLFAGESMFHRETDASKVALVGLVSLLRDAGSTLLDVQWATPHLRSLGVVEIPRGEYLARLAEAIALPQPPVFGG